MPSNVFRPWRSVRLAQAVTAVALLAGVPLFLRMPLWCDLTLYDLAARNLLRGGLHYREVFDTNLPGFVWILTGIRWALGFGAFTLRCVDLAIVAGVVLLIDRVARRGGATLAARWWAVAGVSVLYPFAVEMAHCQRDTWMALPIMGVVALRVRRATGEPATRPFAASALEGVLWGVAVWIKPHVVFMAAAVWLATARRVADGAPRPWRAFLNDGLGNLVGGLVVGGMGMAYLIGSGTWELFEEILRWWGPEYKELAEKELKDRAEQELHWFPPWSLWLVLTVPLAVLSVIDALPWGKRRGEGDGRPGLVGRFAPRLLWDKAAGPNARFARCTLAVLYLAWAAQSFVIQRGYMYVHLSETLVMFGLWAAHRWAMPFVVVAWLTLTTTAWVVADHNPAVYAFLLRYAENDGLPNDSAEAIREQVRKYGTPVRTGAEEPDMEKYLVRHPLADFNRMRHWPTCFRFGLTDRERYALWDNIKRNQHHEASPGWAELAETADFLRSLPGGVGDGDLIAWHDSPHVLYLMLDVEPGFKYMHVNTARIISQRAGEEVMGELWQKGGVAKYAVGDLGYAALSQKAEVRANILDRPFDPPRDLLPERLANGVRVNFPFRYPAVFRSGKEQSGRYTVHVMPAAGPIVEEGVPPDHHPDDIHWRPERK